TFCLKEEAELLITQGFGKGANLTNTLVMDEKGPINNVLRFPDEPVRHKILDLVGDLYLAGNAVEGGVIGIRSGHELNMELVKKIKRSI
nr:UDP-3-O-acyl-N-acetylglucosamine deacetylase [Candidatus Omnitrophota bacterium]